MSKGSLITPHNVLALARDRCCFWFDQHDPWQFAQQDSQFEVQLLEVKIFVLRHCGTLRAVKRVARARDLVGYHPAEKAPIIMRVG